MFLQATEIQQKCCYTHNTTCYVTSTYGNDVKGIYMYVHKHDKVMIGKWKKMNSIFVQAGYSLYIVIALGGEEVVGGGLQR